MLSQINLKSIWLILSIILTALLQIAVMPYFSFSQAIGNLILIMVIIFIFKQEYLKALLWVVVGGFILDLSLGIGFGINIISLGVIFGAVLILQKRILGADIFIYFLGMVICASLIFDLVSVGMLNLFQQNLPLFYLWPIILGQAVYNTILAAVVYLSYYYFEKRFYPEKRIKLPEGF